MLTGKGHQLKLSPSCFSHSVAYAECFLQVNQTKGNVQRLLETCEGFLSHKACPTFQSACKYLFSSCSCSVQQINTCYWVVDLSLLKFSQHFTGVLRDNISKNVNIFGLSWGMRMLRYKNVSVFLQSSKILLEWVCTVISMHRSITLLTMQHTI